MGTGLRPSYPRLSAFMNSSNLSGRKVWYLGRPQPGPWSTRFESYENRKGELLAPKLRNTHLKNYIHIWQTIPTIVSIVSVITSGGIATARTPQEHTHNPPTKRLYAWEKKTYGNILLWEVSSAWPFKLWTSSQLGFCWVLKLKQMLQPHLKFNPHKKKVSIQLGLWSLFVWTWQKKNN